MHWQNSHVQTSGSFRLCWIPQIFSSVSVPVPLDISWMYSWNRMQKLDANGCPILIQNLISLLSLKTEPELRMAKLSLHQGKQFTASYLLCKCSYTHNCKICIFMSKSAFLWVVSGLYLPACSLHSQFRKGGLKIQPQVSSTWLTRPMYFPYPSSCPSWHDQFLSPLPFWVSPVLAGARLLV